MFKNAKAIPAETSMRITALRFLLIVLVVFIHNNLRAEDILKSALEHGYTPFAYENGLFGRWVQIFISDGIAKCAVPLFFMFASYLQFMKAILMAFCSRKRRSRFWFRIFCGRF